MEKKIALMHKQVLSEGCTVLEWHIVVTWYTTMSVYIIRYLVFLRKQILGEKRKTCDVRAVKNDVIV